MSLNSLSTLSAEVVGNPIKEEHHEQVERAIVAHPSTSELDTIERFMDEQYGAAWGFYDGDYARPLDTNEALYIVPGTIDLINNVLEAAREGDPYTTVVFLDKSARPGAHFYRELVANLQKRGLFDDVDMPPIKFMDVGKVREENKIKSGVTAEILSGVLPIRGMTKDDSARVLIVDEFKDTGVTLPNAVREFKEVYGDDIRVDSAYHFNEGGVAPFWYRSTTKKVVRDAIHSDSVRAIDKALASEQPDVGLSELSTTSAEVGSLRSLTSLPKTTFLELFERRWQDLEEGVPQTDLASLYEGLLTKSQATHYQEGLEALSNTEIRVDPSSFYDYFRYAGGRLAAPRRGDRSEAYDLRRMLSKLAEMVADTMVKEPPDGE